MPQKGDIEPGIVGNKNAVSDERAKPRKNFFRLRRADEHFVRNAVYHLGRQRDARPDVYQAVKFIRHAPPLYGNGADLYDPAASRRG